MTTSYKAWDGASWRARISATAPARRAVFDALIVTARVSE
jgi:hypothetical protein